MFPPRHKITQRFKYTQNTKRSHELARAMTGAGTKAFDQSYK